MARSGSGSTSNYMQGANVLNGAEPLSVICWANLNATGITQVLACHAQLNGANAQSQEIFITTAQNVRVQTEYSGGTRTATTSAGFSGTGVWGHCAGVWSTTNNRVSYFNGGNSVAGTGASSGNTAHDAHVVGAHWNWTTQGRQFPLNAAICELAWYSAALTAAQATEAARGMSPLLISPGSLAFYSAITGRQSPERDQIGGKDLTITGTMSQAPHCPRMIYPGSTSRRTGITGVPPTLVNVDAIMPIEWMLLRQVDHVVNAGWSGVLSVDYEAPVEWRLGFYTDKEMYVEYKLGVVVDNALNVAWLPRQGFDVLLPIEHKLSVIARHTLPIEWLAPGFFIVQPKVAAGSVGTGRETAQFSVARPDLMAVKEAGAFNAVPYSGYLILGGPSGMYKLPKVRYASLNLYVGEVLVAGFRGIVGQRIFPDWTPQAPATSTWSKE